MSLKLAGLIKKTEAAIQTETDPKKLRALASSLAMYSATRADMGDDDDGDDDDDKKKKGDDDDGDDESKSAKHAKAAAKHKAKAEAEKHKARAADFRAKAAEAEEAAKKCTEEASGDDDEAHIQAPPTLAIAGDDAAAGALAARLSAGERALSVVTKIEKEREEEKKMASIAAARQIGEITAFEAREQLPKHSASYVAAFLKDRAGRRVPTSESDLSVPSVDAKGNLVLPADVLASIDAAMFVAADGKTPEQAAKIRADLVAAHKSRLNGAGAGERY